MKRSILVLLLVVVLVVLTGCTATLPQANVGSFQVDEGTRSKMVPLGPVRGTSETVALFGGLIVLDPDAGYNKAYNNALASNRKANVLINTYSDVDVTQYLGGLYIKYKTVVYGTAAILDERYRMNVTDADFMQTP